MARLIATMTVALFIPGVAWNRQTLSHFIEGVEIAKQYSLSVDFLNQQNIKVFIIENNPSSGLACALDTCNCVGVIYQTSISHVGFSSFFYRTGMDVHFTYSSLYQERLKKLELKDTQIIPTGYVYDYALNNAPLPDALIELQASLKQQGASKIIVWFLENSLSHWTTQMHPEKQIQLIGEVLKSLPDNHFLIIKPKHVQAFKDYVGCEESLADLVKEHVNLVMLTPSNAQYDTYPFHFARIADACIGDLIGGTAGMEAAMTNCPVYLLDHCAMQKNYPIESVGNLSFVYTDCNKLGQAIASQDKTSKELTADWEAFIQRQVEFLDGNASKRIIDFIDITIEEFTQETDKQAVLERATNRYHARWSDVYNDKKQQIA